MSVMRFSIGMRLSILFLVFTLFFLPSAGAQSDGVTLRLRPRCPSETVAARLPCPDFLLKDPETAMTEVLTVNAELQVEVAVRNPSGLPIQAVQSFLEYDPFTVEVTDMRTGDAFPLIAPGELEADVQKGLIKIGVSNVSGGVRDAEAIVARITMVVRRESEMAFLRFHDWSLLGHGHTRVNVVEDGEPQNVLMVRPRDLALIFGEAPPPYVPQLEVQPLQGRPTPPVIEVPPPVEPTVPLPVSPPAPVPLPPFGSLQPQGLRLTTVGDAVYALFDLLGDSRVAGYNLYYGAVSGRYLNRRTLPLVRSSVIRGLPVGTRLYFAVTAYSADGEESEFSFEAAVTVGDPSSSTSPLIIEGEAGLGGDMAALVPPMPPPDTGTLRGETGFPTAVLLLAATTLSCVLFVVLPRRRLPSPAP
jgi:hypothetical protein